MHGQGETGAHGGARGGETSDPGAIAGTSGTGGEAAAAPQKKTRLQEAKPEHVNVDLAALQLDQLDAGEEGAAEDETNFRTPPGVVEVPPTPPAPRKPVKRGSTTEVYTPRGTCRKLDFAALFITDDDDAEQGAAGKAPAPP